jgi:hypothetical protein
MDVGKPSMDTNIETAMLAPVGECAVLPQPLPRGPEVSAHAPREKKPRKTRKKSS